MHKSRLGLWAAVLYVLTGLFAAAIVLVVIVFANGLSEVERIVINSGDTIFVERAGRQTIHHESFGQGHFHRDFVFRNSTGQVVHSGIPFGRSTYAIGSRTGLLVATAHLDAGPWVVEFEPAEFGEFLWNYDLTGPIMGFVFGLLGLTFAIMAALAGAIVCTVFNSLRKAKARREAA